MTAGLPRAAAAEFVGTMLLLAVIVGSGITGERLASGNLALALMANSIATGCGLFILILIFAPTSSAHFNPLVSILACVEGAIDRRTLASFILAQILGALAGVALAHAMFELAPWTPSLKQRAGTGQWLAEGVATFGLVLTIAGTRRYGVVTVAAAVATYIVAAYWFTASTSFANPAVTLARALTPTLSGIAPGNVLAFITAQAAGAAIAACIGLWLFGSGRRAEQTKKV